MCFWIFWSYMHNFVQLLFNTVHCSMETYWFKRRKIKGDKACGSDCGYIYYLVSLKNYMKIIFEGCWLFSINSQAIGWNSWDQSALELISGRDLIFESDFFVIIKKFILTTIFEIQIHEKKFLDTWKFHIRRPIFINHYIFD